MTWPGHQVTWRDMTCHVATNHSSSPHVTSQPSTLLHLTPQATSWHQNRSHHHHGTAEGSFTAKKWFGHRAGRSPCAHSIGKFFLWLIGVFLWNFRPRLVRALLVYQIWILWVWDDMDDKLVVEILDHPVHIQWDIWCSPKRRVWRISFVNSTTHRVLSRFKSHCAGAPSIHQQIYLDRHKGFLAVDFNSKRSVLLLVLVLYAKFAMCPLKHHQSQSWTSPQTKKTHQGTFIANPVFFWGADCGCRLYYDRNHRFLRISDPLTNCSCMVHEISSILQVLLDKLGHHQHPQSVYYSGNPRVFPPPNATFPPKKIRPS